MENLQIKPNGRGHGGTGIADGRRRTPVEGAPARQPAVEPAPAAAIVKIADPGPLGLACFALTTFVLSAFNAGLIGAGGKPIVFGLALMYGGIAQILAGMWEFRTGNTFGATAFTSYGAFWLSYWAYVQFYAADVPEAVAADAVGLFLLAWGIFTVYMWITSLRTNRTLAIVFGLLTVAFFLLAIGDLAPSATLTEWGGWVGLVTAVGAWYASFAGVANATFGRAVLPLGAIKR
jgi:succinate-acetate transporter protein